MYQVTIITGINGLHPSTATGRVLALLDVSGLAATITRGTGHHPNWDSEPVLIITALTDPDRPTHPDDYRALARALRDTFEQDCVLYHATPVAPFELI